MLLSLKEANLYFEGVKNNMRRMYSKNQIEEIAKASVSSGTKLYKHEVSVQVSNDDIMGSDTYSFVVLNPKSTSLTMSEIVALKPVCIGEGGTLGAIVGLCYPVTQSESYPYGLCKYDGTSIGSGVLISNVRIDITDIVIPL